jgi:hypothetical protein
MANRAERRAVFFVGAVVGALIGCGALGLLGLGITVYFGAWIGDLLEKIAGEEAGKVGMALGFPLGFALYVSVWIAIGGFIAIGLQKLSTRRNPT